MELQIQDVKTIFLTSNCDINTGTLLNGTKHSSIRFNIPQMIRYNHNVQYISLKLTHAELPYSFYVVNENNNILAMSITGIGSISINIPLGNYNATSLLNFFNTFFSTNYPSISMVVSLSNISGKYTFTANISFSILSTSKCQLILGFVSTLVSVSNSITLTNPVDTSGAKTILIKLNNIQTGNYNCQNRDILTFKSIPIVVSPFGLIYYQNISNTEMILKSTQDTNTLDLELTDENSNQLNFNGLHWNIAIEVKYYMKFIRSHNFSDTLQDYFVDGKNKVD